LLLKILQRELALRKARNKLKDYRPYRKQAEFHACGASNDEVLFMAANQIGKTWAGGFETAMHLTGRYPDWWVGKTFPKAIRSMAGSESSELTRKGVQRILMGPPESEEHWGEGSIPRNAIKSWSRKQGVPNALDNIVVLHGGGGDVQAGESVIQFASYDQGRTKWQADTLDFVWFDEEPDEDVYTEGITRTNATGGYCIITFTPIKGMSKVVKRFYPIQTFPRCTYVRMGIDDAEHLTPEARERILAKYPAHTRDARAKGIPMLGAGAVFPVDEEFIKVDAFEIPAHWPQIGGIDFGWDHPTGAVNIAWDRDADVIYITKAFRVREHTPTMFAPAVKPWGTWLKWAWPHDGLQHDKGSGIQLAQQYAQQGMQMLHEKATFEDGSNGLEAGVAEMLDRMQTGRLKVFSHLEQWLEEFRLYHRSAEEKTRGLIVKQNDDLISATRYAMMMRRFATVKLKKNPVNPDRGLPGGWMA
jgi:phage terminase large subunit-like protein